MISKDKKRVTITLNENDLKILEDIQNEYLINKSMIVGLLLRYSDSLFPISPVKQ